MKEEADTSFLQSREVNWTWSSCGSGVGWGFAWGARRQNTCQRKRDWASAVSLWTPGTCLAEKDMEKPAAGNTKSRSKCIKAGTLEVLEFRMCTSASLSQRNKMCCRTELPTLELQEQLGIFPISDWLRFQQVRRGTAEPCAIEVCWEP